MEKVVLIRRTGLGDFIAGMVPICNYLQGVYGKNINPSDIVDALMCFIKMKRPYELGIAANE